MLSKAEASSGNSRNLATELGFHFLQYLRQKHLDTFLSLIDELKNHIYTAWKGSSGSLAQPPAQRKTTASTSSDWPWLSLAKP